MKHTLQEKIVINRPLGECFAYLRDFSTIEQWDPGVYRSRKLSAGAPTVGTEYEVILKLPGNKQAPMLYTQLAIDEPNKLILSGNGGNFHALDTLSFSAIDDTHTEISYRAELELQWLLASLSWLSKPFLNRLGKKAADGLKLALTNPAVPLKKRVKDDIYDRLILPAALSFGRRGYLSQARKSHTNRMDGKTIAITGPTAGIGLDTACELARLGASLVLIGRNTEKLEKTVKTISEFSGCQSNNLHIVEADLSSLKATATAARYIAQNLPRIDVLINNAGALFPQREETVDGFEKSLAVNFLAPVLLSQLLTDHFNQNSRVINVVSGGLYLQALNINDLQFQDEPYDGSKAYARAKRALVYMSQGNTEQTSYFTTHPGWAATPGVAKSLPSFNQKLANFMRDSRMGADTIIWLASTPGLRPSNEPQLWFDRHPHRCDILPKTKASTAVQQQLIHWTTETLAQYKDIKR
ncbi:Fatty acyl-CoA reductase [Zhongshania aliphaticivorans]|uniref:Fatty acyl-CoA reductase n=1 Tax=Zhongshania aliphaticivorans TaxID=1470434 RepID=A0A5S9PPV7_9GAMM|nr:SDR family NAD(P)-dependent oxidoreductase [Zhongshania aliphaticivorans]CAA0106414.1 Fatty acyl-CoA reductase [Zhongshania aliphaticivorans]CAA0106549.1 Fatty acyl-CoA reductase [Zhongshania aliphaticivorans]